MKTSFSVGSCLILLTLGAFVPGTLVAQDPDAGVLYHPSRILVRFKPGAVAAAESAAHVQAQAVQVLQKCHNDEALQLVEVPMGTVLNAVAAYKANADVVDAQPDYIFHTFERIPSDNQFYRQYGMHNAGEELTDCLPTSCSCGVSCPLPDDGTLDADIDAPLAWDFWTGEGNPNFRIAVIDTGVDYNHRGLKANVWINPLSDVAASAATKILKAPKSTPKRA